MEATTMKDCICNGLGVIHEFTAGGVVYNPCTCDAADPEKRRAVLETIRQNVFMRMMEIEGSENVDQQG